MPQLVIVRHWQVVHSVGEMVALDFISLWACFSDVRIRSGSRNALELAGHGVTHLKSQLRGRPRQEDGMCEASLGSLT